MHRRVAWTMIILLACLSQPALADDQIWEGQLMLPDETGEPVVPVLLRVQIAEDGSAVAALIAPQTAPRPIQIEDLTQEGSALAFVLPEFGARGYRFEGTSTREGRFEGRLAQRPRDVPATDIHLLSLDTTTSPWEFGTPRNITDREGYDNQPSFLPEGTAVLYTSMREAQTDIYRFDSASQATTQITNTTESEYSPTPRPGGAAFSTVRVEADGAQRLWSFGLDGTSPTLLLADVAPVGYHAWLDAETLALFVLGEPATLQIAELETGETTIAAEDIGRGLQTVPGSTSVSFIHRLGENDWRIRSLATGADDPRDLLSTRPGSQDFVWIGDRILMAEGSRLFLGVPGGEWAEVADLASSGLAEITRIAVNQQQNLLALVAERPDIDASPDFDLILELASGEVSP